MLKELRNISGGALGWVKQEQFHDALDCTRHTMSVPCQQRENMQVLKSISLL